MSDMCDYANTVVITSERDIFDVFQNNDMICYAIPDEWELLLPRVRLEVKKVVSGSEIIAKFLYFLEGWWRHSGDGMLGYYAKINLETGMVKEFRELPGDTGIRDEHNCTAEKTYLQQCVEALNDGFPDKETIAALDTLWQAAAPKELREFAESVPKRQTNDTFLLPLESLTCWNWEKMRDLLLKRYDTTVEDILDFIEYKKSGSRELYVAPKRRASARENGLRFWRDGYDGQ